MEYILAHLEEPLQVPNIAKAIHVSQSCLQRSFRACAGESVYAHLLRTKLRLAAELLAQGKTVSDAARAVGFGNSNHFCRCFKKEFGINPSQAKKQGI
ncbi:MAG: helix-turn-helix transcriptional regulator [Oscillospiraceae bacterium]|nr:helix-turn-helix transcriptional regulator [Oscillospiraceae bacterium]